MSVEGPNSCNRVDILVFAQSASGDERVWCVNIVVFRLVGGTDHLGRNSDRRVATTAGNTSEASRKLGNHGTFLKSRQCGDDTSD